MRISDFVIVFVAVCTQLVACALLCFDLFFLPKATRWHLLLAFVVPLPPFLFVKYLINLRSTLPENAVLLTFYLCTSR